MITLILQACGFATAPRFLALLIGPARDRLFAAVYFNANGSHSIAN